MRKIFIDLDPRDIQIVERKATNLRIRTDKPFEDMSMSEAVEAAEAQRQQLDEAVATWRKTIADQSNEIADHKARVAELEADKAAHEIDQPVVADTGQEYVSWVAFEAAAITAFGREGAKARGSPSSRSRPTWTSRRSTLGRKSGSSRRTFLRWLGR